MNRLVGWLVLFPLGLVLVVFALANRHVVAIGIDPIAPENPFAGPFLLPMFVALYVTLMLGVLIGGIAAWFAGGSARAAARRYRAEAAAQAAEAERLRHTRPADETLALLDDGESR